MLREATREKHERITKIQKETVRNTEINKKYWTRNRKERYRESYYQWKYGLTYNL
jgi:hypothetical protein